MPIEFKTSELVSRAVRSKIPTRVITGFKGISKDEQGKDIPVIGSLINAVTGFIVPRLASLAGNIFSKVFGIIVSTVNFVLNFNFNASDKELDASVKETWKAVGLQLGGAVGKSLGYLTCGFIPGVAVFVFNEALGAHVLKDVTEEFLDEISGDINSICASVLRASIQSILTTGYKSIRNIIKSNSPLVKKIFGSKAESMAKAWGASGSKPWTIAGKFEEKLDTVFGEDGFWRNFAEEVFEEAGEACIEAGYVVANSLDSFYAQSRIAATDGVMFGAERTVEITPVRSMPDEKIILSGNEATLRPAIVNYIAQDRMLRGKDLGVVYGVQAEEVAERSHRPEVVLRFYGKRNSNPAKGDVQPNISMRVSFRLMNKSVDDFKDDTYIQSLARIIYAEFATPPYTIHKGSQTYSYCDYLKGYQLRMDVHDQQEAVSLVRKVLDIQRHKFDEEKFRKSSGKPLAGNDTKDVYTVQGKQIEVNKKKKEGYVKFVEATLLLGIGGIPPICLIDLSKKKKQVIQLPGNNTI